MSGITTPNAAPRQASLALPTTSHPHPHHHRHNRRIRPPKVTWQSASFHFSLTATWFVIALLWSITPLSWAYLLWTLITLAPALRPGRPAPSHLVFKVLHYLVLSYAALEIPFSVYYRYLAWRAQQLRPPLRHSRKALRGLIVRSLENGLYLEEELEEEDLEQKEQGKDAEKQRGQAARPPEFNNAWEEKARDEEKAVSAGRRRVNQLRGDGAATPEPNTSNPAVQEPNDYISARNLPALRTDDVQLRRTPSRASLDSRAGDEGYGGNVSRLSLHTVDSAFAGSPRSHNPQLPFPSPHDRSVKDHTFHRGAPTTHFANPPLSPSDPRVVDFRNYLRFWFSGCDFSEIKRKNMADWLAWSLYGSTLEALEAERKAWDQAGRPPLVLDDGSPDDGDSDIDEDTVIEGDKLGLVMHCVELVEARAAHRFPRGRNPKIHTLRLTLDPVRVVSRPLILYAVVAAIQGGVLKHAKYKGFKEVVDGHTRYLVRVPKGWKPSPDGPESQRPLVFLHGLGMGMAQYATLLSYFCSHRSLRNRPIMVLLQPHISMSFFARGYLDAPDQTRCTTSLERVMRKLKFDEAGGATVLSHSNGTIVHGWLVKDCPQLVARSCFVDAVCFCLWEPWVCYNFLYSKTSRPIEYLMRYFVSRELGIAVMLSRTFEWTSNLLWPSQIPNVSDPHKTAVFLASEDSILNAERVRLYLRRNGFKETRKRIGQNVGDGGLKVFEGLKHGESMIGEGAAFEEIMDWVCWDPTSPTVPHGHMGPGSASPAVSPPSSVPASGAEDSSPDADSTTADDTA
ncbi:hypothetical protein JCM21900_003168 [Sporobolomyces salmonicolor]